MKKYLVTVNIDEKKDEEKKSKLADLGLIDNHMYTIIDAARVKNKDGKVVQLFQIRNPWGSNEWKGDWSDSSDTWTKLTLT